MSMTRCCVDGCGCPVMLYSGRGRHPIYCTLHGSKAERRKRDYQKHRAERLAAQKERENLEP